jgi:hypothetical protein
LDGHGSKPTKVCRKCNLELPLDCFYVSKAGTKDGLRGECKECWCKASIDYHKRTAQRRKIVQRDYNLHAKYGISLDDYLAMYLAQGGLCLICNKKTDLCVDHCHSTNKVRGLLCDKCNQGIGCLNHDIAQLENAIRYLKENND